MLYGLSSYLSITKLIYVQNEEETPLYKRVLLTIVVTKLAKCVTNICPLDTSKSRRFLVAAALLEP